VKQLLGLVGLLSLATTGCSETPVSFPLRSLERSGEVSFVCVGSNGEGYDINACPDFESVENRRHLLALVTQTLRGEVAIVDLSDGKVVDLDQSTPGYGFIPVGANPIDIVSTPGGVASFVGVAEVGKEGIFAIPSSCARPPAHDLVSWPACSLPYPPGEMAILLDPLEADGSARPTCTSAPTLDAMTPGTALAATREECPADLALETTPPGRRKLLVTFPSVGQYGILDAQEILDREPGTFAPCDVRYVETELDLPTTDIVQKVPADLRSDNATCLAPADINYGPPIVDYLSQPAGIDVSEGRLFMADRGAPLVHVIDVNDPCEPVEQPPLLAVSYDAPQRDNIFTQHVAVSPPTTSGQRFAYAVDDQGDVMIFDATPGAVDRTPIVRPGSPRLPFEAPDRIQFDSPARDITFAIRDVPIFDPETGVATVGTSCEPDPALSNTVGAKYRSNSDFSGGARPHNLRGVFGFIMLASGQVAVIDVEDFDARCRRPVAANSGAEEDFRGCFGDPVSVQETGFVFDGKRTVSNELTCRVVEQHRARSGRVLVNSTQFGVNGPALRNFPRLSLEGGILSTDQTEEGVKQPKLLAVPSPNPRDADTPLPVEVYIGVNLFSSLETAENPIIVDPQLADRPSVGLVLQEPRAFFGDDEVRLTYEGKVVGDRPAGRLEIQPAGQESSLTDNDGGFCDRGVESEKLMRERGIRLGVATADLGTFAREHADYVQVISSLRDRDSQYWTDSMPDSCPTQGKSAFFACRDLFGEGGETLQTLRDFVIKDSFQGSLVIEPRRYKDEAQKQEILELFSCCFGLSYVDYNVRAGSHWVLTGSRGIQHQVRTQAGSFHCEPDCHPRRQYQDARVFEISSSASSGKIGAATPADVACVIPNESPVLPGSAQEACIFQNLTHRFAVYRGTEPSKRDMVFDWNVTGGFIPLTASLASQSRAVSPQSIVFVPQIGQLAVADGAAEGLVMISLDSVNVSRLFF
jgi:hypothetical protein